MEWIPLILLMFALVLLLGKMVNNLPQDYPYQQRGPLLTHAERSFYGVLCQAVNQRVLVFSKVRIADVLCTEKGLSPKTRITAFNRISAKHFDFILCDPKTLRVLAAIELDDTSHTTPKVKARDRLVEGACNAAGLTLHRINVTRSYSVNALREQLFPTPTPHPVDTAQDKTPSSFGQQTSDIPVKTETVKPVEITPTTPAAVCPKCRAALIRRTAKKGKHQGATFMACSSYPKCRYIAKSH